jgi:structural maintenance of chromosome 2
MVEEAAGTRMFEERKDKAKKTMGKKEKRVQEITSLLAEEITPKLDHLRAEKRSFLQWQKACTELERIGRVLRAWEWTEARERVARKQTEIEKKEKETSKTKKDRERCVREGEAAEKDVQEVVAKREAEMKKGGKFKKREEEVAELEKVLVKIRTQVEIKNATIADEDAKVVELENELKEVRTLIAVMLWSDLVFLQLEESLKQKQTQVQALTTTYTTTKDKHTTSQNALSNAEELLQTLLTGLSSSGTGTQVVEDTWGNSRTRRQDLHKLVRRRSNAT